MDTQRDVEVPSGSPEDLQTPAHEGGDVEGSRRVEITQRGKIAVDNYVADALNARILVRTPPSLKTVIDYMWHRPVVLADNALLRLLYRVYAVLVIPVIVGLYLLVAAQLHPASAIVVDTVIVLLLRMWFFS